MKPDIKAAYRGELPSQMEPLLLGESYRHRGRILDLAFELAQKSATFKGSLPPSLLQSLANLVRSMNCYYSNFIEGHATHPIDIERALRDDYSEDPHKRELQLEAKAHITVQKWIDEGGLSPLAPTAVEALTQIHRHFGELLPPDLLWVEDPKTHERLPVVPGKLRTNDVQVGRHVAISPGALPQFLERFALVYGRLGKSESILAAAAAHHRLVWIHPFLDGNGRVARLMSHAQLLHLLDTGSVWSVARGLARNMETYKYLLAMCDQPRRNDLDGRGNLSEEALGEFTEFFLNVCLDQVKFMESVMRPDRLRTRILLWAEEETRLGELPSKSGSLLEALLYRGELGRGDADAVLATGERQARRVVSALIQKGVVQSESSRAPLRLAFPAALASHWLPGLFPDQISPNEE